MVTSTKKNNKNKNKKSKQAQSTVNKVKQKKKANADKNKFGDPSDLLAHRYKIELMHIPTSTIVAFKAWVTGYSDSYQSNWNTEEAYGRMDPITSFQSTTRAITLEWDVVSSHETEAKDNMRKCETLFKMLYPTYLPGEDGAGSISAAPLFKMKFGNLITKAGAPPAASVATAGLVGTMAGFDYAPDFDAGFFLQGGAMFPQTISLSAEFQVIHNFKVGWDDAANEFRSKSFPYGVVGAPTGGTTQSPKSTNSQKQKQKKLNQITKGAKK